MTARRALEPPQAQQSWLRRHRSLLALLIAVVVLVGGGWIAVQVLSSQLGLRVGELVAADDYPGPGSGEVVVEIPMGTSLTGIGDLLVADGVVASTRAFTRAAAADERSAGIQAGSYRLANEMSAAQALESLLDSESRVRNTFRLREGNRLDQQLATIAEATGIAEKELDKVFAKASNLDLPSWAKRSGEGFLYPDTYEIPSDPTAASIATMIGAHFTSVADSIDLEARAEELGVTPYQAVVVASIIEKEVFLEEDRPKVARVIYNRLAVGMRLGMDSTAIYASAIEGLESTNYGLDSPYNTRVNKGLPPGPIGSPGRASLEAALDPAAGDWLFFVTVNMTTGETEFSDDEAGFARSVRTWKQWCAESDENQELCTGAGG